MEIYVDGIKQTVTSGSNSGNATITGSVYNSSRPIEIGPQNNSGYYAGHISNLRVIKGTALYTSNFTPPTEPLTTTSQGATASEVKLLCCQSNNQPGGAAVLPYDITVTSSNNGNGSVGSLSAITSTGSNYYLDYRTVGRAWVQLDY